MNSNTALIVFTVIAAFGLATATFVVLPQAQATVVTFPDHPRDCRDLASPGPSRGECAQVAPKGPPPNPGPP
jgi:hypothetical protein